MTRTQFKATVARALKPLLTWAEIQETPGLYQDMDAAHGNPLVAVFPPSSRTGTVATLVFPTMEPGVVRTSNPVSPTTPRYRPIPNALVHVSVEDV